MFRGKKTAQVVDIEPSKDFIPPVMALDSFPEEPNMPSYHDLYVTTKDIPRTKLFDMPYGYEVSCNRVGGWCLWFRNNNSPVAGEYSGKGKGLVLDVNGVVIVDSLNKKD